jgi:hypothetical protein
MSNKIQIVKIDKVKINKENPRIIKDSKYQSLVKSIKEFPKMLNIRPIVVDENYVVLGGNMRLRACQEAGLKEIPIIVAEQLTENEQREFVIKDNVSFGEWDWELLANDWDATSLVDWGLDVPIFSEKDKIDNLNEEIDSVGLPEFETKDTTIKLTISFENEKDREEFVELHKIFILKKQVLNWSTWWPEKQRQDLSSLKYEI